MNLSDLNENLEKMALPPEIKKEVLKLIDTKINEEFRELREEIRRMGGKIGPRGQAISSRRAGIHLSPVHWLLIADLVALIWLLLFKTPK